MCNYVPYNPKRNCFDIRSWCQDPDEQDSERADGNDVCVSENLVPEGNNAKKENRLTNRFDRKKNINVALVRAGYAWWYKKYAPFSDALREAEREAARPFGHSLQQAAGRGRDLGADAVPFEQGDAEISGVFHGVSFRIWLHFQ